MSEQEKQDALDRKGAWIERMFDRLFLAIRENVTATILVLSLALNFWFMNMVTNLQQASVNREMAYSEKMIEEVRRGVERETTKQMAPIQAKQDSLNKTADTSFNDLRETLESFKQKYLPKKK